MLSVTQLQRSIDSLTKQLNKRQVEFDAFTKNIFLFNRESARLSPQLKTAVAADPLASFDSKNKNIIFENALNNARTVMNDVENNANEYEMKTENIDRFYIEYYRRFTWSLACFVLFLIGAPLGAIIRKGGLGLPILVSILFFLLYHVISISGEKMAKEGDATVFSGMWAATFILLPVGLFLIYKATRDSALLDTDAYLMFFKRIFSKRNK